MTLPVLRRDLDMMPSPAKEQPGLLIRDSMRYSEAILIVPWALTRCLECFDGEHDEGDLRAALVRATGELDVSSLQGHLVGALRDNAFLEDEVFVAARDRRQRDFATLDVLPASHAGAAYPADVEDLKETMRGYVDRDELQPGCHGDVRAIAAPHVSPFGGWESYRAAYSKLPGDARDRTFVVLGTSHYGEMNRFGLTRKRFETPLGSARSEGQIIDRLLKRGGPSVTSEDYCFAVEHSVEFQVLFLQWLYGPEINIVPILCGSFARSIVYGGLPEENEDVARFLGELGEIADKYGDELVWVLGIDMAHIGRRYGDRQAARAYEGHLAEVAERDRVRSARVVAGDARGFWELVQQNRDDLRWCGSAPLYTFLKAVPGMHGTVERYDQWNIDEASVVSFAGISFTRP